MEVIYGVYFYVIGVFVFDVVFGDDKGYGFGGGLIFEFVNFRIGWFLVLVWGGKWVFGRCDCGSYWWYGGVCVMLWGIWLFIVVGFFF